MLRFVIKVREMVVWGGRVGRSAKGVAGGSFLRREGEKAVKEALRGVKGVDPSTLSEIDSFAWGKGVIAERLAAEDAARKVAQAEVDRLEREGFFRGSSYDSDTETVENDREEGDLNAWDNLPDEMVGKVVEYFEDTTSLCAFALSCRRFYRMCHSELDVWQRMSALDGAYHVGLHVSVVFGREAVVKLYCEDGRRKMDGEDLDLRCVEKLLKLKLQYGGLYGVCAYSSVPELGASEVENLRQDVKSKLAVVLRGYKPFA